MQADSRDRSHSIRGYAPWLFAVIQLWVAHAIGYLIHEYAHTFTAWLLHGKANPFALDYGHRSIENLLFQSDIDENVDYPALFASGRGTASATIALAGVLLGNGSLYLISRFLFRKALRRQSRFWALFFFWLIIMSVGNFLGYVPVRTFTNHADMATVARGFNVSSWLIAIGLGLPFAMAIWHFFARILPDAEAFVLLGEPQLQGILALLSTFLIFDFFGGSGIRNYGPVSYGLSAICVYLLFPLVTILCWQRLRSGTVR